MNSEDGTLNYEKFLQAFDEGQEAKYKKRNQPVVRPESFSQLAPDKAMKKLRKMVMTNVNVLQSVSFHLM